MISIMWLQSHDHIPLLNLDALTLNTQTIRQLDYHILTKGNMPNT